MPTPADLALEIGPRVLKIAVFIAFGVAFADLLVRLGAIDRIAALSRYLTRPANLPDEVGAAILTTAASTTAGYGMLAEFRESGALDDRATLVAVTINTFFGFVQHIFTFYAPVLIPILGLEVGLLYVGSRAAIALAITLTGVLAGRLLLSEANVSREATVAVETDGGEAESGDEEEPESLPGKARAAAGKGVSKTRDILPRLAVIYTAVALLTAYYNLETVTGAADPLAELVGLPVAAVPVIAVFAIDTTSGAVAIAPLLGTTFTPEQAVATMLVGGIVSFAVSTFKRSIPFQYGIWGAEFGSKVVAVNTALKLVFIATAVGLLLYGPV